MFVNLVSLSRQVYLKSGLGPTAEILSFAWPKESIQRKGHPEFRLNPALLAFGEGFRKGLPSPSENERHPCRSPAGYSRQKLRCSGRNNGSKTLPKFKVKPKKRWVGTRFSCPRGKASIQLFRRSSVGMQFEPLLGSRRGASHQTVPTLCVGTVNQHYFILNKLRNASPSKNIAINEMPLCIIIINGKNTLFHPCSLANKCSFKSLLHFSNPGNGRD